LSFVSPYQPLHILAYQFETWRRILYVGNDALEFFILAGIIPIKCWNFLLKEIPPEKKRIPSRVEVGYCGIAAPVVGCLEKYSQKLGFVLSL
jgi:hypothetical protein